MIVSFQCNFRPKCKWDDYSLSSTPGTQIKMSEPVINTNLFNDGGRGRRRKRVYSIASPLLFVFLPPQTGANQRAPLGPLLAKGKRTRRSPPALGWWWGETPATQGGHPSPHSAGLPPRKRTPPRSGRRRGCGRGRGAGIGNAGSVALVSRNLVLLLRLQLPPR